MAEGTSAQNSKGNKTTHICHWPHLWDPIWDTIGDCPVDTC